MVLVGRNSHYPIDGMDAAATKKNKARHNFMRGENLVMKQTIKF